ncbi:MAG TPA: response regulator transcription factor [Candidatus Kapabacteria bacterium]|nr:response regulator transcription factor [Candidatus Kapabacteria bacterium]
MEKIRLVIIEDNRLLREGLTALIEEQPDIKVIASFDDSDDIMPKIYEAKPHVVLLELGLQNQNSLTLVRCIKNHLPATNVIAMDIVPMQEDIFDFVQAGVSGFILKDATIDKFLLTIRSVAQGETIMPSNMAESLFSQIIAQTVSHTKTPKAVEDSIQLTKRERQVIVLIAEGMTNKEIAQKLNLSTYTVKSHVHNILEKLAMRSRLQIANYASTQEDFTSMANKALPIASSAIPKK